MMGTAHNCKPSRRCKICGKPDYCNWIEFPNGDTLEYCKRLTGNIGDTTIGQDGSMYTLKKKVECKNGYGEFSVWESSEQLERNKKEYIEKLKAEGKYVPRKDFNKRNKGQMVESAAPLPKRNNKAVNSAEKAEPARLNEVFRTFLSLLVLEEKHKDVLRLEWDEEMLQALVKTWNIKSVPPEDKLRFSSKEKLQNDSRKRIMEELIKKVGEPKGVPGFYRRKDGVWTFCYLSGIAYPIVNSHNEIVGLEIGNDYPTVEKVVKDEKVSEYRYFTSEQGTGWHEIPRVEGVYDYKKASLVWEYGSDLNKIALTQKNLPIGKVNGKYKPFFSEKLKTEDGRLYNVYDQGCSGGSPASLYVKDGDDLSVVYVTEGAKKAMVANYVMNIPVIMLSGVGKFGILFEKESGYPTSVVDELGKRGAKLYVIAYDADKNSNILVLNAEKSLVKMALQKGLKIAVAEWNASWGKGLDDILLTGVMPQISLVA